MTVRIEKALKIAKDAGDYKKFREEFYKTSLEIVMCDSRETVPCALALFYLANGDPVKAIIYGVNFGRDADTIGTMVGALAGAFKGVEGLKHEWVTKVERIYDKNTEVSNSFYNGPRMKTPDQYKLAEIIVDIIRKKIEDQRGCIELFEQLSGMDNK